jgi:hypothetical protein
MNPRDVAAWCHEDTMPDPPGALLARRKPTPSTHGKCPNCNQAPNSRATFRGLLASDNGLDIRCSMRSHTAAAPGPALNCVAHSAARIGAGQPRPQRRYDLPHSLRHIRRGIDRPSRLAFEF